MIKIHILQDSMAQCTGSVAWSSLYGTQGHVGLCPQVTFDLSTQIEPLFRNLAQRVNTEPLRKLISYIDWI
ncbi:hypothetical protein DPMN_016367 [Dreissena polymorpha]|uniref:Uncharacterized protein n=1 Tax=Dreissena polymorpha TaxID=45954 RepID=A0A9D4N9K8_DREPO|nr:hypothetical protein DPMN_016367 [Dreissena polymorpha]